MAGRQQRKRLVKAKSFSEQLSELASEASAKGLFGTKRQVSEKIRRKRRLK